MEVIIPGMEPTGHYWLNLGAYLQEQGMKPVHVNPHHVKKSKELDDNNPSKNDRKDPKTIAGLVNEGRFSYPYIPTGIYAEIRNLSNLRIQTQEEITRIKNRMARWFSMCSEEQMQIRSANSRISYTDQNLPFARFRTRNVTNFYLSHRGHKRRFHGCGLFIHPHDFFFLLSKRPSNFQEQGPSIFGGFQKRPS